MEELMRLFVRPPRHRYSLDALGPSRFELPTKYDAASRTTVTVTVARRDFVVLEQRSLELQCSLFYPAELLESQRSSSHELFDTHHHHHPHAGDLSTSTASSVSSASASSRLSSDTSTSSSSSMPRSYTIHGSNAPSHTLLDTPSLPSPSMLLQPSVLISDVSGSVSDLLTLSAPASSAAPIVARDDSILNRLESFAHAPLSSPPASGSGNTNTMLRQSDQGPSLEVPGNGGAAAAARRRRRSTRSGAKSQPSSPDISPPRLQVTDEALDTTFPGLPPGTPCLLVLHGNAGSRTVALELVELVCAVYRIALCTFDFAGCGRSGGEYITLGHTEPQQIHCVVRHLRDIFRVGNIGLYGISMGAASALLYTASHSDDDAPACLILDGSFANLYHLSKEILNKCSTAVASIAKVGLPLLRERIQRKYGLDIKAVQPDEAARSCHQPALFLHGKDDTFVSPEHCTRCFTNYAGSTKEMLLVEGDHNSPRQVDYWDAVANWIFQYLVPPSIQAEFHYTPAKVIDPAKTADHSLCFYSTRALYIPEAKSAPSSPTGSPASSPRASSGRPVSCTVDLFAPNLGADCLPHTPQFISHRAPVYAFCVLGILPEPLSFVIYRPYSMLPEQVFDASEIQSYGALPEEQVFFLVTAGPGGQQRKHIFMTTKPGVIQRAFQKTLEQQFNNRISRRAADETAESIKRTARTLIDRRLSTEGRVSERHLAKMAETICSVLQEAGTEISLADVTTIVHEIVFERTGTEAADLGSSMDSLSPGVGGAAQKKKGCVVQ